MTTPLRLVCCFATLMTPSAFCATLSLGRSATLACPAQTGSQFLGLQNTTATTQTVPAGTVMTLTFSAPVPRPTSLTGATVTASGNTMTFTFTQDRVIPVGGSMNITGIPLDFSGLADGTAVSVTFAAMPASALTLTGQGFSTVVALIDTASCTAPTLPVVTADDLIASCPPADEIASINADLNLTFTSDPTAGTLVCRAADGSADLTRLQERTYQTIRILRQLSFDTPLPWTEKSLYDWMTTSIKGIYSHSDISNSFCCSPANTVNIAAANLGINDFVASEWIGTQGVLYTHESRHNNGLPHTCGSMDQTINELGAWAAQYYLQEWMIRHSDPFLTPRLQDPQAYRSWFWNGAQNVFNFDFCDLGSGVVASPSTLDFGTQAVGSPSASRSIAITLTKGASVTVSKITLGGTNSSDFKIATDKCTGASTIPSCPVTLTFTPSAAGTRTATLSYTFGSGTTQSATLTGIGGNGCTYSLSATGRLQPTAGGSGQVTISTAPGCAWTATPKSPWLGINAASGTGTGSFSFTAQSNPKDGARQGLISIAGQTIAVAQAGIPIPTFHPSAIVNAASFLQGASPGAIGTIFGTGLTRNLNGIESATMFPFPTSLETTSIELVGFNSATSQYFSEKALMFAIANVNGQEQINFQLPYTATDSVEVRVHNNGLTGAVQNFQVRQFFPGLFTVDGTVGAFLHGIDGTLITSSSPAARGETIVLFATGLGPTNPSIAAGLAAPTAEPFARTTTTPIVQIGGIQVQPAFSGLAPGYSGLYQLNVVVPQNAPTGNIPITLNSAGALSKSAFITIR